MRIVTPEHVPTSELTYDGTVQVVVRPYNNGGWIDDGSSGDHVATVFDQSEGSSIDWGEAYSKWVVRRIDIIPVPLFRLRRAIAIRRASGAAVLLAARDNLELLQVQTVEAQSFDLTK